MLEPNEFLSIVLHQKSILKPYLFTLIMDELYILDLHGAFTDSNVLIDGSLNDTKFSSEL